MSIGQEAYIVDTGTLLTKDDNEFDAYAVAYDKKYGYYDDGSYYLENLDKAVEDAMYIVLYGTDKAYGIVSKTMLSQEELDDLRNNDLPLEGETFDAEDVIFSCRRDDEKGLVYNFIEGQEVREDLLSIAKAYVEKETEAKRKFYGKIEEPEKEESYEER